MPIQTFGSCVCKVREIFENVVHCFITCNKNTIYERTLDITVIYKHCLGVKRENVYLSTSRVRIEYDGQLSVKYIIKLNLLDVGAI